MDLWLATAKTSEIDEISWAPIVGIITNPSVLLQAGADWRSTIRALASHRPKSEGVVDRIHLQSIALDHQAILGEMEEYAELLKPGQLIPKVPVTRGGIAATRDLLAQGYTVNMTALCSLPQVEVALDAGATYLSMYVARINDASDDGIAGFRLVEWTRDYIDRNGLDAQIMAASVRTPDQYAEVIRRGAHAVAAPPLLLEEVLKDDLTDRSLQAFADEWRSSVR